ncbi:MAG: helix-turn-helix transcriptional regulator [Prevotellaceae bacterium]|jgi:transcriptional regulator with XRE-family HTH domain|nr:helix-turn-helix transcriptional regulator [Prevotellaceae bacterium]
MTDRLTQFLATEQLSPTRFADLIGVQRSGVSHILAGRNKPGYDFLEKFLTRFPAVNIEWFITGKGKMYKDRIMPELFDTPVATLPAEASTRADAPEEPPASPDPLPPCAKTTAQLSAEAIEKNIEKVMIFYSDNTFCAYYPNKKTD